MSTNLNILNKVLFSKTAKNTVITLLGNVSNAVVVMVLTITVSRFLGPEKFGLFSVALTLYLAGFDLFGFGIEQGVIRFISHHEGKNEQEKSLQFIRLAFKLRIASSIILLLLALVLPRYLALSILNNPDLIIPFTLVFLGLTTALLTSLVISILQAYQKFVSYAILYSLTGVIRLILTIFLLISNTATINNLLGSFVFAPIITFLLGIFLIPRAFLKVSDSKKTFLDLFHYSKWIVLWAITTTIHTKIDIFVISKFLGDYETGIYSAASRLTLGIVWLNSSIAMVLTPKFSRYQSNGELKSLIKKGYLGISVFVVGIVVSIIFAPIIIPIIYGEAYSRSIKIFQTLMLGMIFFMLSTPPMVSLTAMGKSKVIGMISLFQVPIVLIGNLFLIPVIGILGSALIIVISNLFVFLVSSIYVITKLKKEP